MKVIFTEQAFESLEEALNFISFEVSYEKLMEMRNGIVDAAETLAKQPFIGQQEMYLEHLGLGHRRIVEGNYKIIYRVTNQCIYITDIFDTRQNPEKMKG